MPRTRRTLRALLATALVAAAVPVAATAADAAVARSPLACTITANPAGAKADTSTVSCVKASAATSSPVAMAALGATIAIHYEHVNYGGSTLTVYGSCGGSWINVPSTWIGYISSTLSFCGQVDHHLDYWLGGWYESTYGSGNLTWSNDLPKSVQYW